MPVDRKVQTLVTKSQNHEKLWWYLSIILVFSQKQVCRYITNFLLVHNVYDKRNIYGNVWYKMNDDFYSFE